MGGSGESSRNDDARRRALGTGLPDEMRMGVVQLLAFNVLTCGVFGAFWTYRRTKVLDALDPPMPLTAPLTWAAIVAPYSASVTNQSRIALAGIVGTAAVWATWTYNYRFVRILRWRAELLAVPFEMGFAGWLGWFCFGQLYLQHKVNGLMMHERVLAAELAERLVPAAERAPVSGEGTTTIAPARLKNKVFWALIDNVDRAALARGDDVAAVAPLRSALVRETLAHRRAFHETLAQKLFAFDGPMFAAEAGAAAIPGGEDRPLLARTFVVASGQARYREVLATPSEMPKDAREQCAALLHVACDATADAGEAPVEMAASVPFATGSNTSLWGSDTGTAIEDRRASS